ncbi:hypothetical protein I7X12_12565 [Halosimplex litoreum]|uniref:Uncharacterized protein n=1 Tax=Halosimplex litoreum TaxID=1198301 RepID=A0A7T3FVS1_9EURY|nr:hypothetical protein [Halosimplex litoreum]QPV61592.1 hypothetical protein I7X12_12565 [Halosimplex litoreum]
MGTKDYDYIEYDERLFRQRFMMPIDEMGATERLESMLDTISDVFTTFKHVVRPTEVTVQVTGRDDSAVHERTLTDTERVSFRSVSNAINEMAEQVESPLPGIEISSGIRTALSDGIHHLGGNKPLSRVERSATDSSDVSSPLQITTGYRDYTMPCLTESVTLVGHSDHWLDGDEDRFYLPEATPLAKLDQSRLAAALSTLYDTLNPVEIAFDVFENTEGWHTPSQTVPAYESLLIRHAIEWVLENFEQRRLDENTVELEFTGGKIHPLIYSPDKKVETFLRKAFPQDRYSEGATATVHYPADEAIFVKDEEGKWDIRSQSDL